jgi:hypothetical protein
MIKKSIKLLLSSVAYFSIHEIYSDINYTKKPGEDHFLFIARINKEYNEEKNKRNEIDDSDIEIAKKRSEIDEIVRKISKYTKEADEFLNREVWQLKGRRSIYDYFKKHFKYQKNPYELIIDQTDYTILAVGSSSSWDTLSDKEEVVEGLNKKYNLLQQSVNDKFNILYCKEYLDEKQKDIILKALTMQEIYNFLDKQISNPSIKEDNPGNTSLKNIINKAKIKSEEKILREIQIIMYYLTKAHQGTLNSYINELYKR